MADRTLATAPAYTGTNQNVVAVHAGITCVPFNYVSTGASVTVSDVIYLAKIPAGAIITRLTLAAYTLNSTATTLDVGMSGDVSADYFYTHAGNISQTGGTTDLTLRVGSLPYQVSVSDDAVNRFKYLQAKVVTGDTSLSLIVKGVVEYIVGRGTIA